MQQELKDLYLPAELGSANKQPTNYFCKILTASDTSNISCGFSVPCRAARKVFPPLVCATSLKFQVHYLCWFCCRKWTSLEFQVHYLFMFPPHIELICQILCRISPSNLHARSWWQKIFMETSGNSVTSFAVSSFYFFLVTVFAVHSRGCRITFELLSLMQVSQSGIF